MTARRRPELIPRGLTIGEVAEYLGHARNWLTRDRLDDLVRRHRFPALDPVTARIDLRALDLWLDERNGIFIDSDGSDHTGSPQRNSWREAMRGDPVAVRRQQDETRRPKG